MQMLQSLAEHEDFRALIANEGGLQALAQVLNIDDSPSATQDKLAAANALQVRCRRPRPLLCSTACRTCGRLLSAGSPAHADASSASPLPCGRAWCSTAQST